MMEEVSKLNTDILTDLSALKSKDNSKRWSSYIPVILVFVGSFLMLGIRLEIGASFVSDGALMMLALAS